MKGLVAAVGALALSLGLATQASAITFNYAQLSGFVDGTEQPQPNGAGDGIKFFGTNVVTVSAAINGVPAGSSTYRSMAWGEGSDAGVFPIGEEPSFLVLPGGGPNANKSGLLVLGQAGTIAPGETKVLTDLFHRNQAISPPDLTQFDIYSLLTIKDSGDVTTLLENRNNVRATFNETDNNPPGGLGGCDAAIQFSTTPCDDFFHFPLVGFAAVQFIGDDGNLYELTFSTFCVNTAETRCDIPDPSDPSQGLIRTAEGNINHLQVLIHLEQLTDRVPAPASLLLLGLGILGAGILRRKVG
jgi:hypothetical protein